jgi:predicted amidohydrolase YtcJ
MIWWIACHSEPDADLLVRGAIHPDADRTATAMAVRDGVIVALDDDAEALRGPETKVVDATGKHVYAGFEDAHTHLMGGAFALDRLMLLGSPSMETMASKVEKYAADTPDEPWIVGYGWLPDNIESPDRAPIDAVVSDRPVILVSNSGHMAIVNGFALDRVGITASTPDPSDGKIGRYEDGTPNGYLEESAMELVSGPLLAAYDDAALSAALPERLSAFSGSGLTGIHEIVAVPGLAIGRPWIYTALEDAGQLPLRVTWYAPVFDIADLEVIDGDRDIATGERVQFGGVKVWVDGSMSNSEGWVDEPYEGTESVGTHYFTQDELNAIVLRTEELGMDIKFHVNGDAAVHSALDAVEYARTERGELHQRHVFEHAVLVDPPDLARMQELGVIASVQPTHILAAKLGDVADNLGERFDNAYDYQAFTDGGVPMALGTDWPVWITQNPLNIIWAAATAQADTHHGMTVGEAIRGYTEGSAKALGRESELGKLDVGYLADFVVLGADPQAVDPKAIPDVAIEQVFVGGVQVK